MPPKTKEEMKEYNRQLYLKRKERKLNGASVIPSFSNTTNEDPIELVITEVLPKEEEQIKQIQEKEEIKQIQESDPMKEELENIEEIMREFMAEMFEEEKDEIIKGTVKYMYYKLYHKIHAFQKLYKEELSPEYRTWIYNWRNVNKEFYEFQL